MKDLDDVSRESSQTPDAPSSSTTASAENLSTEPEAAQLNATVRQLTNVNNGAATEGFLKFKEQAAMLAPMIPAARGYVEGILAVLFVVAAYSIGFGTWKYMTMWCVAQASVCFYRPVALLGYKVAEYFMLEAQFAQQLAAESSDPLVFGGARVLKEQLVNIQSIYLCFELAAFLTFCVGAISMFRSISQMFVMPRMQANRLAPEGASSHSLPHVRDAGAAGAVVGASQGIAATQIPSMAHQAGGGTRDDLPLVHGRIDPGNAPRPPSGNWL